MQIRTKSSAATSPDIGLADQTGSPELPLVFMEVIDISSSNPSCRRKVEGKLLVFFSIRV